MIRKGIIEKINSAYAVAVRIPELNRSSSSSSSVKNEQLLNAVICSLPGISPAYQVGDMVILGFENDEVENPVVLGLLYRENIGNSVSDITVDSLTVQTNIALP